MATISEVELSDRLDAFVRRAQAGERFTISVDGQPTVVLGPASAGVWVEGARLRQI